MAGSRVIRVALMLLLVLLVVLLGGCATRRPRCEARLRPINVAAGAPAAERTRALP